MSKFNIKPFKHYFNRIGHKVTVIETINMYDYLVFNHTTGVGMVINQEGFVNADHSPDSYDIVKEWQEPKDFWIPIIQHENWVAKRIVNASQSIYDTEKEALEHEPANPAFKTLDAVKYTLK